tara:strand:- start:1253 stop:1822 length:570 start_codon:yes stop_codon:yes gene_type:complete
MVAIYVLRLERGKYYVGLTRRNVERIWQHIDGKGAAWTKKYPPKDGKEIVSFQDGLKVSDEDRITLETMARYGVKNVRGGSWCRVNMSARQISELERLVKSKTRKSAPKSTTKKKSPSKKTPKRTAKGYCIRCGDRKKLDFQKPLCRECYDEWAYYGNPDYEEECCHKCGRDWATTIEKPLCIHCWRKS